MLRSHFLDILLHLEKIGVITTDPRNIMCCGLDRDDDGRCVHRPYHPVYVRLDNSAISW